MEKWNNGKLEKSLYEKFPFPSNPPAFQLSSTPRSSLQYSIFPTINLNLFLK